MIHKRYCYLFCYGMFSFLAMYALLIFSSTCATCNATYLNFRSPSRNTVAKLVGTTTHHIFLPNQTENYVTFFINPTFKESFRGDRIAQCLFGDCLLDNTNNNHDSKRQKLKVSGSQVINRDSSKDLMAENFYLPQDFESIISFKPHVRTFSLDFHLYVGLDHYCPGMYLRLYGPYVHNNYDLQFNESQANRPTADYPEGFFSSAPLPVANLLESFTSYARGDTMQSIPTRANTPVTIKAEGLKNAKITGNAQNKNCFGDLRCELGYNVILENDCHLGLNLQAAAPTGPKPKGTFLFEPQCGNGGLWEFGFGITGHKRVWCCDNNNLHSITFWLEVDITHMFGTQQLRTFDLKEKPLSRYMLAQQMDQKSVGLLGAFASFTSPNILRPLVAFNGTYAPVANFITQEVTVSADIQADVTAMFTFNCDYLSWDLGYNFWIRTCEKIKRNDKQCIQFFENTWALKGDSYTSGFQNTTNTGGNRFDPHPVSATQSTATIHTGQNAQFTDPDSNSGIDAPLEALVIINGQNFDSLFGSTTVGVPINTSIQPILISENDLNLCSGTRGLSHKLFTHINYTFEYSECWQPYLGIGAAVELGATKDPKNSNNKNASTEQQESDQHYITCALTDWSIWLKAGLSWR